MVADFTVLNLATYYALSQAFLTHGGHDNQTHTQWIFGQRLGPLSGPQDLDGLHLGEIAKRVVQLLCTLGQASYSKSQFMPVVAFADLTFSERMAKVLGSQLELAPNVVFMVDVPAILGDAVITMLHNCIHSKFQDALFKHNSLKYTVYFYELASDIVMYASKQ